MLLLAAFTAGCGGGGSSSGGGTVTNNPVPSVSSLSPSSATAGGSSFTLTVSGSNFVSGATVRWNAVGKSTTFVSSTQLTVTVTTTDIATAGTVQVSVSNPTPGGGLSNSVDFSIEEPVPAITSISPSTVTAGSPQFTLTVNGSGFTVDSVVNWNGSARTTTFVSNAQLTAAIPASDISSEGTAQVTVVNPAPGGGTSNAASVTISTPVPTISSISPTVTEAGRTDFTLTVNGFNFTSNSVVNWNGSPRTTTFVSAIQLTATILAADVTGTGTFPIQVLTPGSPDSNTVNFTVAPATSVLQITTQSLPPTTNDGDYYFLLATSGSTGSLTWAVTNGSLPSGLSLNTSTGLISGTVSGVTSGFSVQVSDSASPPHIAFRDLSITVASLGRNDNVCISPGNPGTDVATPISNGRLRASISPYMDIDTYSFTLTQPVTNLSIETFAQDLNIGNNLIVRSDFLDTVLELLNSNCTVIALNDDLTLGVSTDSRIQIGSTRFPTSPPANPADIAAPTSLPAGTYYIRVRDYRADGRPDLIYDLKVSGIQ